MIEVERNPRDFIDTYLSGLNSCFPGWGDRRTYAWAFERTVGAPRADLMVLRDGGVVLAGSAVSYRTLRTCTGRQALVGIMTGSWTLPAARGQGCFARIIDESVALVRSHRGALLLAYVTQINASFRRLEAAGSALFPTRYIFTTETTPSTQGAPTAVVEGETELATWFARFELRRGPGATVTYASRAQWSSQFLERPDKTAIVEAGSLGFCLVEEHADTDRLQGIAPSAPSDRIPLIRAMLARAQKRGRKLFFFSASPVDADACITELGLGHAAGYLTMLAADEAAASTIVDGSALSRDALAHSASFARWALHSGDRM